MIIRADFKGLSFFTARIKSDMIEREKALYKRETMKRVMWIEYKGDGIVGPAKIGWANVKNRGKKIDYGGQSFRTLSGHGFKANFYEINSGDHYWISGCRKDGRDGLYNTDVEIDEDALEEYWVNIRNMPKNIKINKFRARGKY